MTKQKIFGLVAIIIILVAGGFWFIHGRASDSAALVTSNGASSSTDSTNPSTTGVSAKNPNPELSHAAWLVLQKYLTYAKAHDLAGVTATSFQLSAACKDPKRINECYKLMDGVQFFGRNIKEKDFTNMWYDSKQIILFTELTEDEPDEITRGEIRSMLFFTRGENGEIKLLAFKPSNGAYVGTKDKSEAQIKTELANLLKDTDQDALSDMQETCSIPNITTVECPKTDPNKRDTNGNGWWDGVEILMHK